MLVEIVYDEVFQEIQDFLMNNINSECAKILAQFVVGLYWGDRSFDLKKLEKLDLSNFENCIFLLRYRRTKEWNDTKFWGLAMFAKTYC